MVSNGLRLFIDGLGKLNNLELNISQKIQKHIMNNSFKIKVINWQLKNHESLTNAAWHFSIRGAPFVIYQLERLAAEDRQ